jgi:hypothetical protein
MKLVCAKIVGEATKDFFLEGTKLRCPSNADGCIEVQREYVGNGY